MPALQVLNSMQQPSYSSQLGSVLGEGLGQGLSQGIGQYFQMKKQRSQGSALAEYLGKPEMAERLGALPPEIQIEIAKAHVKQKEDTTLKNEEYSSILDDMERVLESGKSGRQANILSYLPGFGEEREATAKFQSQGRALLGLAQQVALKQGIRNQREFDEFVKNTVPNANDTVETARGKINALRSYLKNPSQKSSLSKESSEKATQLQPGQTFEKLPSASGHPNAVISKGNKRYISNGKNWKELK